MTRGTTPADPRQPKPASMGKRSNFPRRDARLLPDAGGSCAAADSTPSRHPHLRRAVLR